ncbi:MAG TPA: D-hexose-6-phosphate mutarotase [Janthinobacterium sp.]|jgi:glucose-6-phosphate 1-epimerase|nr:D-hexose-6-phosphate mutarotase [Janthinobacterium sp.]
MAAIDLTQYGALPAVRISAADGAQAVVTLYGAHLVSWKTADGQERLFCSALSALDGSRPIRGGVPLIFPQFSERGTGMRHGFARVSAWRLDGGGEEGGLQFAEFSLAPADLNPVIAAAWPYGFELRLRVALRGDVLEQSFTVRNTGAQPFPFSAALHAYYLVEQVRRASVGGLQHVRYADDAQNVALQDEAALRFDGKLDRIYYQVPGALTLHAGAATLLLEQDGFTDAVVWNPGAADAAALADMEDEEYQRFVCIEAALIEPDLLAAGAEWTGWRRTRC